ncbi:MAG: TatD family hydrolase [Candidatus Thiodiazotropha sp.]|jgi:TatD DNase family protein
MGIHPRLIDAHSHFDDERFDSDRPQALERARAVGIQEQIIPAIKKVWWPRIKQLCLTTPGLYPSYGLHPMFLGDHQEEDLTELHQWLIHEAPVAIGECGLDFAIQNPLPEQQQLFFEAQLQLALEFDLPVIIHARRSVEAVIHTLRRYPGIRGMLHSYSGSEQQARQLIDMGFYLSFGGPITYMRAKRLQRMVENLPLESLLLETDSPDQPGCDHPNSRNEPSFLTEVLNQVARLRNQPIERVANQILNNAHALFRL